MIAVLVLTVVVAAFSAGFAWGYFCGLVKTGWSVPPVTAPPMWTSTTTTTYKQPSHVKVVDKKQTDPKEDQPDANPDR